MHGYFVRCVKGVPSGHPNPAGHNISNWLLGEVPNEHKYPAGHLTLVCVVKVVPGPQTNPSGQALDWEGSLSPSTKHTTPSGHGSQRDESPMASLVDTVPAGHFTHWNINGLYGLYVVGPHNSGSSSLVSSADKLALADGMHLWPAAQSTQVWLFSIGV